jgi:anti-anti-sigma factor
MSESSKVFLERLAGRLSGEIDFAASPAAKTDLLALARCSPGSTITIDCMDVTFIDSSGVHMLEQVAKRSGKNVRLFGLPQGPRRVFEISGLCEKFGIDRQTHSKSTLRGPDCGTKSRSVKTLHGFTDLPAESASPFASGVAS